MAKIIQPTRKRLERDKKEGKMKKWIRFSALLNGPAPANRPAAGFGDIGVRKHSIPKDFLIKEFYMGFRLRLREQCSILTNEFPRFLIRLRPWTLRVFFGVDSPKTVF